MCGHCFSYGLLVLYLHWSSCVVFASPDDDRSSNARLAACFQVPDASPNRSSTSMSLCEPDLQPLVFELIQLLFAISAVPVVTELRPCLACSSSSS